MSANRSLTITAGTLTVGGDIGASAFSLTKLGAGALELTGTNNYTGGTRIDAGYMAFGSANSVGGAGANLFLNSISGAGVGAFADTTVMGLLPRVTTSSIGSVGINGAVLGASSEAIDLTGYAGLTFGALGTVNFSGSLATINNEYRLGGGGGTLNYLSNLTGAGNSVVIGRGGAGTVAFNSDKSYGGGTLVTSLPGGTAGTLHTEMTGGTSGSPSHPFGAAGTTITLNGGALDLGSAALVTGQDVYVGGYNLALASQNNIKLTAGTGGGNTSTVTLAIDTLSRPTDANGTTAHGGLMLTPTNTGTATVPVAGLLGGREKVTVTTGAPASNNGMVVGAYFDATTFNFLDYGANGFVDATQSNTIGSGVAWTGLNASSTVLVRQSGNFGGSALTNNSTVYAARIIETGVGSISIGASGETLTVGAGGLLTLYTTGGNMNVATNIDYGANEGIWTVFGSAQMNAALKGTGGFVKYGPGTLNITANPTLTGGFTVAGGILSVGNANIVFSNNNISVLRGGTFALNGRDTTILSLTGDGQVSSSGANVLTINGLANTNTSTFTGLLTGLQRVIKTGTTTQEFTGVNSYTGSTTINGGVLSTDNLANGGVYSGIGSSSNTAGNLVLSGGTFKYMGGAISTDRLFQIGQSTAGGAGTIDASGTGALNFTNTGNIGFGTASQTRVLTLAGSNTDNNTLRPNLTNNTSANSTSLVKTGTGVWILSGTNTYTGVTTINGGKLLLGSGGSLGNTAISVNDTGTFGGSGTATGSVTVNSGGAIAAGNSIGILNTGALSIGSNGTFALELNTTNGTSDQVNVTGNFSLTSGALLTVVDLGGNVGGSNLYTILNYTGVWNNNVFTYNGSALADGGSFILGNNQYTIDYNYDLGDAVATTNAVTLTAVAVPEADSVALGLGVIGCALLARRRKVRQD